MWDFRVQLILGYIIIPVISIMATWTVRMTPTWHEHCTGHLQFNVVIVLSKTGRDWLGEAAPTWPVGCTCAPFGWLHEAFSLAQRVQRQPLSLAARKQKPTSFRRAWLRRCNWRMREAFSSLANAPIQPKHKQPNRSSMKPGSPEAFEPNNIVMAARAQPGCPCLALVPSLDSHVPESITPIVTSLIICLRSSGCLPV